MVSGTKTILYSPRPQRAQHSILVLLPSTSRRSQLARHVHPRHGFRNIYTPLHAPSRSSRSISSRSHGFDSHSCLCGCRRRDTGTQVCDIHMSISNDSQLLDLVAYSGYKFVGVIVTLVVAEILNGGKGTGGWVGWTVFTYTFLANAFFLVSSAHSFFFPLLSVCLALHLPLPLSLSLFPFFLFSSKDNTLKSLQLRSLKYVLLPDSSSSTPAGGMQTVDRASRNRRTQFLFLYSYVVQFVFMWVLSRQDSAAAKVVGIKT